MGKHNHTKPTSRESRIDLTSKAITDSQLKLIVPNTQALTYKRVCKRANNFLLVFSCM